MINYVARRFYPFLPSKFRNMENRKHNVDEILAGLDGVRRAEAPGFFYTRLKARMLAEKQPVAVKSNNWLLRPAFVLGALAAIILLNAVVLLQRNKPEARDADTIQTIAAEYSLPEANSMYDLAIDK